MAARGRGRAAAAESPRFISATRVRTGDHPVVDARSRRTGQPNPTGRTLVGSARRHHFEQTFRFARRRPAGAGAAAQASVFPSLVSSDWLWEDTLVSLTWRDALPALDYCTITPQVQFPREDRYEPRFSLRTASVLFEGGSAFDVRVPSGLTGRRNSLRSGDRTS